MRLPEPAREAIAFLTPLGGALRPSPAAMTFFPSVGASIGLAEGALWWVARRILPPLPAAVVALGADVVLTGALHLDGLADSADGLLAHVASRDRLVIMADPAVGTFGGVALGLALLSRVAALGALTPSPLLLGALACGSRSVMVLASRTLPYAREEGLASAFLAEGKTEDRALRAGVAGLLGSAVLGGVARGGRGLLAVALAALAATGVLLGARRRIGGFTGDVLGASGVVFECVGLVVAASR